MSSKGMDSLQHMDKYGYLEGIENMGQRRCIEVMERYLYLVGIDNMGQRRCISMYLQLKSLESIGISW